jgi:hypothetical protein
MAAVHVEDANGLVSRVVSGGAVKVDGGDELADRLRAIRGSSVQPGRDVEDGPVCRHAVDLDLLAEQLVDHDRIDALLSVVGLHHVEVEGGSGRPASLAIGVEQAAQIISKPQATTAGLLRSRLLNRLLSFSGRGTSLRRRVLRSLVSARPSGASG